MPPDPPPPVVFPVSPDSADTEPVDPEAPRTRASPPAPDCAFAVGELSAAPESPEFASDEASVDVEPE
jgi:hypothetical protein